MSDDRAKRSASWWLPLLLAGSWVQAQSGSTGLPQFDFKTIADAAAWYSVDVASLTPASDGLAVQLGGPHPQLFGPGRDYPANQPLWLHLRLKSEQGGSGRITYFKTEPREADRGHFQVPAGLWHEAVVALPPLEGRCRLRIEPPGQTGTCILDRLWFEERVPPSKQPAPVPPATGEDALEVRSGLLQLRHAVNGVGAFTLNVADQLMAVGNAQPMVTCLAGSVEQTLDLGNSPTNVAQVEATPGGGVRARAERVDAGGARWTFEQVFTPASVDTIQVEARAVVDQDRLVLGLPLLTLLPGLGSFGTNKIQGLFCGLEFLENEPSSSQADVTGSEANRQAPDPIKITFPLMAIAAQDRYVGLIWEPSTNISAVFDSPDRILGSAGHLMGLWFPPQLRLQEQSVLLAEQPTLWRAHEPLTIRAAIIGGRGRSLVPALKQYVALRGLPPVPNPMPRRDYFKLAAHAWLDSEIRTNALFHGWMDPADKARPAADAAVCMRWLAERVADPALQARLLTTADQAIQQVSAPQKYIGEQIGYQNQFLPALVYNVALVNTATADGYAHWLLSRFEPDGTVWYQPDPAGPDYGKTHYAHDASGLTANRVQSLLEHSSFAGNRQLLQAALKQLRAMDKFRNTVPRGAQTPPLSLHAPDILSAARLLRCYTLGYELTGDAEFLEQARYWAWSGLPFVYLVPPTPGPVGAYTALGYFGAGAWIWSGFGLPIPSAGLTYAEALYRLARCDPDGPWQHMADGIAAAGIQQSWPVNDPARPGLLAVNFNLRSQVRNGPAVNPAHLQTIAPFYFREPLVYDFHAFRRHGLLVFAPGEIADVAETGRGVAFTVKNWSSQRASVLVNGFRQEPSVWVDGQQIQLGPPHQFQSSPGRLELHLLGTTRVQIECPEASVTFEESE